MNRIIINYDKDRVRAALVEDDQLVEFHVERAEAKLVGNIYVGKVVNVLPGMQAAFIDIGLERNAFLYVDDTYYHGEDEDVDEKEHPHSISEVLQEGEMILVQVKKDMFGTKGPRVTSYISLAGRMVVYLPLSDHVGISKKIVDEAERDSLREIGHSLVQKDEGMIIRTKALEAGVTAIEEDLAEQRNLWRKIYKRSVGVTKPTLVYKDFDLTHRLIRDIFTEEIDELVIDDAEEYVQIKEFMSETIEELADRITLYQGKDVFWEYNIAHEIEKLIKRQIWLKSGGYIIIEKTEALTVIDVNTGRYVGRTSLEDTLYRTNMEAAAEAARQLRLRDIGGIIIIDFIDMADSEHKEKVVTKLTEELAKDRMRTSVSGMTPLGLVELTRKKVRASIDTALLRACPCCEGKGRVYAEDEIYALLRKEAQSFNEYTGVPYLVLEVNPFIAEQLKRDDEQQLAELSEIAGREIRLRQNSFLNLNCFNFLLK
jgi:ribonuclease G